MIYIKNKGLIIIFFIIIVLLTGLSYALPIQSCTPAHCPYDYYESEPVCNDGVCYINCSYFTGCSDSYSTVYTASEYLPDLNIPSYSGAWWKGFQIGNFTPNDASKCYRFRQTTPNNFISSSDIDGYDSLTNFDSGIALFWVDYNTNSMWYDNQRYYSTGDNSDYIWDTDTGGAWIDSCIDDGDNFNSADSYIYTNNLYCAPNQEACSDLNLSYCDTDCYNAPTELELVLLTELANGKVCNSFSDFDNTGSGIGGEIDYVNFDSQTVYMYVDESPAIANDSFTNVCHYWPECNPADPCCGINGYFRSEGYACKTAHNATCDTHDSNGCDGHAYEDRCAGSSSDCPDNNYEIDYDNVCNDIACVAQSCSGYTFQPERTCNMNLCQTNSPYDCPNNLNCLNALLCKKSASSSSDCKTNYVYDTQNKVCWLEEGTAHDMVYDKNGNLISGFGLNYSYNNFNQLVNITDNVDLIAKYFYDSEGNRIKSIIYDDGGNTTIYYFDNFVQIVNSSGIYNETYFYYYNKLIGKKDLSGNIYSYHPDILGSTSLITDEDGNEAGNFSYEPFGGIIESSGERYTFTGYEQDSESNLLYAGARYYDPDIAQFIQADNVIGDIYNPQDLNKYAYGRNNPYKYTDPNGEFVEDIPFIAWDIYDIYQEGFTTLNVLSLGVDILGLAIPLAGGGGRAIKAGARGADLIQTVDKANDVGRVASGTGKAIKSADKISDLIKTGDKISKPFTKSNFRSNLIKIQGGVNPGPAFQAHHNLPQASKFSEQLSKVGINVHDPQFGTFVETKLHQQSAYQYNKEFGEFLNQPDIKTKEQITDFAREISTKFGFNPGF